MRGVWAGPAVLCLSIGLAACEGAAHGACDSADDIARKVTVLTDDLANAQASGKITAMTAGEIGAAILDAGRKFGGRNPSAYCTALDKIRADAKL